MNGLTCHRAHPGRVECVDVGVVSRTGGPGCASNLLGATP